MSRDATFSDRPGAHHINDEARHEATKIEAPIESVSEGSQVVFAVFAVLQRVERAGQRGIQITQHGVDQADRAV